ncbi:flavin reductase (DIM6/NTAB) family NADH-FMN oxidoreductase RutF [Hydrogenispora ethanolica]|uniref:Flavin reductase (DIM6/NTAB) family NADH-FMN oxidoreductase RutF n=2 Tax=Hydrogenispora ethanolica TaxID=1082276 RepID=A0A4R1S7U3_HYDET|nr:flavin reductase (DIM6/NTAB) family NADH-FMN oxidoreductase RutF [Hydrogenispora ethanolica]
MNPMLQTIAPEKLTDNVFDLVGKDWMLITAGDLQKYNTMTASWGGFGILWGKKVCFCVVRPSRYTYQFMEASDRFTLSFFPEQYREALNFCGSKSGRDVDKAAATGLTPVAGAGGLVYFDQARLVMECAKLYYQDLDPAHFLDPGIEKNYQGRDYHRMYIGEITRCLLKEAE